MKILSLLVGLLLSAALTAEAQESPTFAQYSVAVQQLKPKKPDLKTNSQAKQYGRFLRDATKKGINFAGQYVLTSWSCGSRCLRFAVVDAKTGNVFLPENFQKIFFTSDEAGLVEYKPESRLLVLKSAVTTADTSNRTTETYFYEWTGAELKLIENAPKLTARTGIISKNILPEFALIISQLENKTQVPVLLPAVIPAPKFLPKLVPQQEGNNGLSLYSSVSMANDSEYELSVDITPDCAGRVNCAYGRFAGRKNSSPEPVSFKNIEFNRQKGEKISLANGINGFYVPAPTDAKALAGAQIFWLDGSGNQYMVSLKRMPKEDVVLMANSAINNLSIAK